MERELFYDFLEKYRIETDMVEIVLGEPLRYHTSFRIGGAADVFATPWDEDALQIGLRLCRRYDLPWFVLGRGSNILAGDKGFRGVIFDMTELKDVSMSGTELRAGAGASLAALARTAAEAGLTGLEFAAGIPGTLGGAIFMNAGAYGGEMKDIVDSARVLMPDGEIRTFRGDELAFAYRSSCIGKMGGIVLSAVLRLQKGEKEAVTAKMQELQTQRSEKQPLEFFSAGSTFKRPEGAFAAKLIEDAGLKGLSEGAAQVSEKHAGFIINRGGASAEDVRRLMRRVQEAVAVRFGVELEPEIRFLGDFRED